MIIAGVYEDVIYIPDDMGKHLQRYRATLGHKINHSFFKSNCRFEIFHHARFGLVHAVKSTESVKKDEEILCHYNWPYDSSSPWYQELWRKGASYSLMFRSQYKYSYFISIPYQNKIMY